MVSDEVQTRKRFGPGASFFSRARWQVQFLEADLKTPLPRKLTFTDLEGDADQGGRPGLANDLGSDLVLIFGEAG